MNAHVVPRAGFVRDFSAGEVRGTLGIGGSVSRSDTE